MLQQTTFHHRGGGLPDWRQKRVDLDLVCSCLTGCKEFDYHSPGSVPSAGTMFLICLAIKGSLRPALLSSRVPGGGWQPRRRAVPEPLLQECLCLCLGLQTPFHQLSLKSSLGVIKTVNLHTRVGEATALLYSQKIPRGIHAGSPGTLLWARTGFPFSSATCPLLPHLHCDSTS